MKKIKIIIIFVCLILLFLLTFYLNNKTVNRIRIQKLTSNSDGHSATGEILGFIDEKNDIKIIKKSFDKKVRADNKTNLSEKDENCYELTFYINENPQTIFPVWISEDWDKAIYCDRYYFYLSEEATTILKKLLFHK